MALRESAVALLREKGIRLNEDGIECCLENARDSRDVWENLLNMDIRDCTMHPERLDLSAVSKIAGPAVYQVVRAADASLPKAQQHRSGPSARQRVLSLILTDGDTKFKAIEVEPIPSLALRNIPPGTKVQLQNAPVSNGVVLLSPGCFTLLGGEVESLLSSWRLQASHGLRLKEHQVDKEDPPPPFVSVFDSSRAKRAEDAPAVQVEKQQGPQSQHGKKQAQHQGEASRGNSKSGKGAKGSNEKQAKRGGRPETASKERQTSSAAKPKGGTQRGVESGPGRGGASSRGSRGERSRGRGQPHSATQKPRNAERGGKYQKKHPEDDAPAEDEVVIHKRGSKQDTRKTGVSKQVKNSQQARNESHRPKQPGTETDKRPTESKAGKGPSTAPASGRSSTSRPNDAHPSRAPQPASAYNLPPLVCPSQDCQVYSYFPSSLPVPYPYSLYVLGTAQQVSIIAQGRQLLLSVGVLLQLNAEMGFIATMASIPAVYAAWVPVPQHQYLQLSAHEQMGVAMNLKNMVEGRNFMFRLTVYGNLPETGEAEITEMIPVAY